MHFLHKQNASSRAGGPEDPTRARAAQPATPLWKPATAWQPTSSGW